jgi:ankyrin repeat protein
MILMLLKLGADAGETTRDRDLAFHMAAQLGDLAALEMLKSHDIDVRDANENTALLRAVEALQKEMVLYLLKKGGRCECSKQSRISWHRGLFSSQ